jgi:uncharacterized protein (TIGR03083 family)
MKDELLTWTHQARQGLAEDLGDLTAKDWRSPSLCPGWDVEHVVAHLTAAASTTQLAWLRSIILSRFRAAVHNERRLREHLGKDPAETLARFRAVIASTVAPSNDLAAYFGEVLVHGEDIRRPLGIPSLVNVDAATQVAEFYASRDFAVNSKSLASGLHLRATDGTFEHGRGPELAGPTLALVMSMAGRPSHLGQLTGDGVPVLASRLREGA